MKLPTTEPVDDLPEQQTPSENIAISAKNLTKKYRIFGRPTDRIKQALTLGRVRFHQEFTALRDVSFEIAKGEAVGIVGRNGSGKSTLLQLICGILKPTSGEVRISGRISALLELGSGFNPDFTGRENVYFQGAIMGIAKPEIEACFDDIEAFADIGAFIDQPIRIYSSGMFVRLAFSVAVHFEPDVLIVDEALAVGDEAFQRKCFAKLAKFRDDGKTLFLVSHSANVIATVCRRAILLDRSRLIADGSPTAVLAQYQKLLHTSQEQTDIARDRLPPHSLIQTDNGVQSISSSSNTPPTGERRNSLAYPASGATIDLPRLLDPSGESVHVLQRGQRYIFQYRVRFQSTVRQVRFTMMVKTVAGFELGGLTSHLPGKAIDEFHEGENIIAQIEFACRLLPGTYFLNAGVLGKTGNEEQFLHRIIDILSFKVAEEGIAFQGGVVDFS